MDFDPASPFGFKRASHRSVAAFLQQRGFLQIALVIVAAIVIFVVMLLLGRAPRAADRLERLETQADRVASARNLPGDLAVFPAGSVCRGKLSNDYQRQIALGLAPTGLTVVTMDVGKAQMVGDLGLKAYDLRLVARGPYMAAVSGLSVLAKAQPAIYTTSLTMKNQVSDVDVVLQGRVYCR